MNTVPFKNQKVYVSGANPVWAGDNCEFFLRARQAAGSKLYPVANVSEMTKLVMDNHLLLLAMDRDKLAKNEQPMRPEQWFNLRETWLSATARELKKGASLTGFRVSGGLFGGIEYGTWEAYRDEQVAVTKKAATKATAKKPATKKKAAAPAAKKKAG